MATILDKFVVDLSFRLDPSALRRAERTIQRTRQKLDSLAGGAARAGAVLTGALGLAGRSILGFESAFNELSAVYLDETEANLKKLREQALTLGSTTSKSASDAIQAQTEFARSGKNLNEVLAATPAILNLAIAGSLEMAEAAQLVGAALNTYELDASKAERITDLFAATASKTAFTVKGIGPAFRQVGAIANAAGIPIEETLALLGTLRSGGLINEQTGTAARNIISILSEKPTPAVEEGFKSLGLTFDDVQKQFKKSKSVVEVFRTLKTAGLDTTSALEIFGREAGNGALILASQGKAAQELTAELVAVDKTADAMRKRMESGLPGAVAQLTSSFEGLLLTLGKSGLTGFLTSAAKALTNFNRWLAASSPFVQTLLVGLLAAGPALLALGAVLKGVSIALGIIAPVFTGLAAVLAAIGGTAALPFFAALAALAGVVYLAWEPISAVFVNLWNGIAEGVTTVMDAVTGLVNFISNFSLAGSGAALIGTLVDGIKSAASGVYDAVAGALSKARDLLPFSDAKEGPFSRLTESGQAIVDTLGEGIRRAQPLKVALMAGALAVPSLPALQTLAAPLPVGPLPTPHALAGGQQDQARGRGDIVVTLEAGAIQITAAPDATGPDIAQLVADAIGARIRAATEQSDSQVRA